MLGWPGELDATRTKPACPRGGASMRMMTEDCLYLNIYTKNLIKRNNYDYEVQPYAGNRQSSVSLPLRPVIVFITGQDFQGQSQDNFFLIIDCLQFVNIS